MNDCLSLRGVCKSYEAGVRGCAATVRVLRDVDLDVAAGEIVAISAAPSAGKTTLLMCAAGLLRPDRGSVSWFGAPPRRDMSSRPDGIAFTSDRPFPYGFLSIREALEYAAIVRDLPLRDCSARVNSALERTGLDAIEHRRVDGLTGGQLARLALAGALLACPRLILVDDLASGCDADTAHVLLAQLRVAAAHGAGVVIAGRLLSWLPAGEASDSVVATRRVSLVGGRIELEAQHATDTIRQAASSTLTARVAEHSPQSSAHQNGAR
jgi:ABC-type multidrug transport system ATPase subunit